MGHAKLKMSEADIASVAEVYFRSKGWELYPEAVLPNFGGRPDIVGAKQQLCMVTEVKASLSYPVLEQLTRWHHEMAEYTASEYADETTKGIPHLLFAVVGSSAGGGRISDLKREIIERYRIGVLFVTLTGDDNYQDKPENVFDSNGYGYILGKRWRVLEAIPAKIQIGSRQTAQRILKHLNPDMRCIPPGVSGKHGGYMTPFKRTIAKARTILERGGEWHIQHIVDEINQNMGGHHYTSDTSAKSSIAKFLEEFNIAERKAQFVPVFTLKDHP